jgi:hypothetical protein
MGQRTDKLKEEAGRRVRNVVPASRSVMGQFFQNATSMKGTVPYVRLKPGSHPLRADHDALVNKKLPLSLLRDLNVTAPKSVWWLYHLGRISLPSSLLVQEEQEESEVISAPVDIFGKPITALQGGFQQGPKKRKRVPISPELQIDWKLLGQSITIDVRNKAIRPSRGFLKARSSRTLYFSKIAGFGAINLDGFIAESSGVTLIKIELTSGDDIYLWFSSWEAAWPVNLDEPDGLWYIGSEAVEAALNWIHAQLSPKE